MSLVAAIDVQNGLTRIQITWKGAGEAPSLLDHAHAMEGILRTLLEASAIREARSILPTSQILAVLESLHPVQDVDADIEAVQAGFTSRDAFNGARKYEPTLQRVLLAARELLKASQTPPGPVRNVILLRVLVMLQSWDMNGESS